MAGMPEAVAAAMSGPLDTMSPGMVFGIEDGQLRLRIPLEPCEKEPCITERIAVATNSRIHKSRWHHIKLVYT
eukprot:scaffold675429_cov57-Prasinocladus_malaysianus.AAC.1